MCKMYAQLTMSFYGIHSSCERKRGLSLNITSVGLLEAAKIASFEKSFEKRTLEVLCVLLALLLFWKECSFLDSSSKSKNVTQISIFLQSPKK